MICGKNFSEVSRLLHQSDSFHFFFLGGGGEEEGVTQKPDVVPQR